MCPTTSIHSLSFQCATFLTFVPFPFQVLWRVCKCGKEEQGFLLACPWKKTHSSTELHKAFLYSKVKQEKQLVKLFLFRIAAIWDSQLFLFGMNVGSGKALHYLLLFLFFHCGFCKSSLSRLFVVQCITLDESQYGLIFYAYRLKRKSH